MRGHIRQRGTASWQIIAYGGRDPVTGRKIRPTQTVRGTRRDAEAALARLIVQVGDGARQPTKASLNTLLDEWLGLVGDSLSPKTLLEYNGFANRYIRPTLGDRKLGDITTPLLDRFYADLKRSGGKGGRPLAPATVRKVHVIIRRALGQAAKWGWLDTNPAAQATPPKVQTKEIQPPSPSDISRLLSLAAEHDQAFVMFVRLAAATGARRGELCALRWSDFSSDLDTVTISRALTQSAAGYVEGDTKTHAARKIGLSAQTAAHLRDHRREYQQRLQVLGCPIDLNGLLFSRPEDPSTPWRPDTVTRRFVRLRRLSSCDSVRLHDLRHYVATQMLVLGVPVRTVSGRLGHKSAAVTLNTYGHFIPESDRDAAELLDGLLEPPERAG